MTPIPRKYTKRIYILIENNYLKPGVEALIPKICKQNMEFSVEEVPDCALHDFIKKIIDADEQPNVINYFIAEKHIFYILKLNKLTPKGVLIPPTATLAELERILSINNKKMSELNSHFYYRKTHSYREVEVVSLLLEGLTQKSIAERLGISVKTVSHHKHVAIKKSGFSNFNEYYIRNLSVHSFIEPH